MRVSWNRRTRRDDLLQHTEYVDENEIISLTDELSASRGDSILR